MHSVTLHLHSRSRTLFSSTARNCQSWLRTWLQWIILRSLSSGTFICKCANVVRRTPQCTPIHVDSLIYSAPHALLELFDRLKPWPVRFLYDLLSILRFCGEVLHIFILQIVIMFYPFAISWLLRSFNPQIVVKRKKKTEKENNEPRRYTFHCIFLVFQHRSCHSKGSGTRNICIQSPCRPNRCSAHTRSCPTEPLFNDVGNIKIMFFIPNLNPFVFYHTVRRLHRLSKRS